MKTKRSFFPCLPPEAKVTPVSLRQTLKGWPSRVPLHVECVERKMLHDYIREKIVFDVERGLSCVAWVCRPRKTGRVPGILCCHGAGPGKDPLIGLLNGETCLEYHKLAAVRLARRGYVTITPDRRGFGERTPLPYNSPDSDQYRIKLEEFYRQTRHTSLLALDIWDGMRALDILAGYADTTRLACLGVYDGAAVAASIAAFDKRIKAVSLACFTGDAELCRNISPRPLQIQIAAAGPVAPTAPDAVRRAYGTGQESRHIEFHYFDGVLELDFQAAAEWFDQTFKPPESP